MLSLLEINFATQIQILEKAVCDSQCTNTWERYKSTDHRHLPDDQDIVKHKIKNRVILFIMGFYSKMPLNTHFLKAGCSFIQMRVLQQDAT